MSQPQSESKKNQDGLSTSGYRTLIGAALVAIELGETHIAARMVKNLAFLRPDLPQSSSVGMMCDFFQGEPALGMARLRKTLEEFPDYQMGIALLASSMKAQDIGGWQAMLEGVIEDGRDEYAIGLACELLGRSKPLGDSDGAAPAVGTQSPIAGALWA